MSGNLTPYLLALSAGLAYAFSALLAKRAMELGAGTSRSLIYSNWITALFFLPYPLLADSPLQNSDFQNGAILGGIFFTAQSLCFAALRSGDASMVTPIMGSKSVFVALFLFLLGLSFFVFLCLKLFPLFLTFSRSHYLSLFVSLSPVLSFSVFFRLSQIL